MIKNYQIKHCTLIQTVTVVLDGQTQIRIRITAEFIVLFLINHNFQGMLMNQNSQKGTSLAS
jgi:hypothetical protein